jgi:hypothetical protein
MNTSADPICPVCGKAVAAGVPVIFDHGAVVHLNCYVDAEGLATVIRNFLESRARERFCYTCLGRHLVRSRQKIEKAATALRLDQQIVVRPDGCSTCLNARVTVQSRQVVDA